MCCPDDYFYMSAEPNFSAHEVEERTDVGDSGSDADFNARVSLFGQLALEELIQLGVEDTIGDELSPLRYSGSLSGGGHLQKTVDVVDLRRRSSTMRVSRWWE